MNRRHFLAMSGALAGLLSVGRRSKASSIGGYLMMDSGTIGTRHWTMWSGAEGVVSAGVAIRDGSVVPGGASITVTVGLSGNNFQLVIPAGSKSKRGGTFLPIENPNDLLRWSAAYSGMNPVDLDIVIQAI